MSGAVQRVMFGGVQRDVALQDAIPLREALEAEVAQLPPGTIGNPFLIVLTGLPGTGKTYFAGELQKRFSLRVLESDRLRKILVPHPKYTSGESARLFAACHLLIEEYLGQGRLVLFDATNLTEQFRQPLYLIAQRTSASLVLLRFTAPQEIVRQRLADRAAGMHTEGHSDAGWLIYSRMYPHEEPISRQHLNVDSSVSISGALDEVVRLIGERQASHRTPSQHPGPTGAEPGSANRFGG